jgi:tRNA threonylcarbamoyl adenosine modification protein YeaZ
MIVLGIETSTARSSVAVLDGGVVVASEHHEDARGHGAFLAPAVRRCLEPAGGAAALAAVAVGIGPGLYTGLRVGMATAAALASARGIPVVGIGGLEVLARMPAAGADEAGSDAGLVVATLDARRGQVFWAVHEQQATMARCIDGPRVGTREQLDAVVAELAEQGTVRVVGELAAEAVVRPDAVVLARLAAERLGAVAPARWTATFSPAALAAVYLRDADVRVGWNARGGVRAGGVA